MNVVPWRSMCPTIFSAISVSNPRSGMDRIATVVSKPSAVRNPAVSSEMYDAPTHSVLPGASCSEKMSSEVMQHSLAPGASRYEGRPPTAITNLSAVSVSTFPFFFVAVMVCGSTNAP